MTHLVLWLSGIGAFIAASFTALAKVYKFGPFLPEEAQTPPVAPELPPVAPIPPAVVDRVKICALAQQTFEGWAAPGQKTPDGRVWPAGTQAWKHNNPGNIRDIHGVEIHFITYEAGFAALEHYIRAVATGKHLAYPKGGETTLLEYCHTYTGDPEPSPTNYAKFIANALKVDTSYKMKDLLA